MASDALVLELRGITKRFPGVVANDGIDFDVRRGRCTPCWGRTGRARPRS